MRELFKYMFYGFFKLLGVYRILRKKHQNSDIVLTYHGVLPDIPEGDMEYEYRNFVSTRDFENQIKFLLKKYKPLKVADLINNKTNRKQGFLITFDDGFRNNYLYAFKILKKYNLQGCFFVITDLIGDSRILWTEQITRFIQKTKKKKLWLNLGNKHIYEIGTVKQKEKVSKEIRDHLKKMHPVLIKKFLSEIETQITDVEAELQEDEKDRYLFMTWEEVKEMADNGQIIGSHSHTHPILSRLLDDECYDELKTSKVLIEKYVGTTCNALGYPNGEKKDFSDTIKLQLRELGYELAFTQIPHFNTEQMDPYELRRINISSKMSMPVFEALLCGFKKGTRHGEDF